MFERERQDLPWDGDVTTLSDEALQRLHDYVWQFVDPARREELQCQILATDGPVLEDKDIIVPPGMRLPMPSALRRIVEAKAVAVPDEVVPAAVIDPEPEPGPSDEGGEDEAEGW